MLENRNNAKESDDDRYQRRFVKVRVKQKEMNTLRTGLLCRKALLNKRITFSVCKEGF